MGWPTRTCAAHAPSTPLPTQQNKPNHHQIQTPAHNAARNNAQTCYKMLATQIGVDVNLENNDCDTPADLLQQCTRHNQASKDESGTTQVYAQRMVKMEEVKERSRFFQSMAERDGTLEFVGTNKRNQTPAEMRAKANVKKLASPIKEYRPPPPKGPPPKFQERSGRLSFEFNR